MKALLLNGDLLRNFSNKIQTAEQKATPHTSVQAENGEVLIICLKLKDGIDPQRLIKQLSKRYPNNSVGKPFQRVN